jgi:hypothetical protein
VEHHLHFDLLWCLAEPPHAWPTTYCAPSWSWISVDGKVHQEVSTFLEYSDNMRCEIEIVGEVRDVAVTEAGLPTTSAIGLKDGG